MTVSSMVTLLLAHSQPLSNIPFVIVGFFSDFKVRYIYAEKNIKKEQSIKSEITLRSRDKYVFPSFECVCVCVHAL